MIVRLTLASLPCLVPNRRKPDQHPRPTSLLIGLCFVFWHLSGCSVLFVSCAHDLPPAVAVLFFAVSKVVPIVSPHGWFDANNDAPPYFVLSKRCRSRGVPHSEYCGGIGSSDSLEVSELSDADTPDTAERSLRASMLVVIWRFLGTY